jgi:hypothetical protein
MRHKRDVVREKYKQAVAQRRWESEVSGIVVNGLTFGTTDREKALMAAKCVSAMNKPGAMNRYKTEQGWITLPSAAIIELALTVEQYVQLCFDREGELVDAINAAEDPVTVDIQTGWPVREYTVDFTPAT